VRALGRPAVEALEATGLAAVGDEVRPQARIAPVGELLIASDAYSTGADDPPDYVAGYTPTSRICDSLTPRRRAARALDLGTGNGIHALLAAGHTTRVVATDVNPRALAYTGLNAALNGITNVECRSGSLFDPAAEERFDLITCNAPFVVSPESSWAYRDSGLRGDDFSALVVAGAAERLGEGGFATLLVSWLAADPADPDGRARAWAEATGCDVWILSVWSSPPLDHAAGWNADLGTRPAEFAAALDRWLGYLDGLGARWVSEGAVLLHRREGARGSVRVDDVDEDELDAAGRQVRRAFAARARLDALGNDDELLDTRPAPVSCLRLERELALRPGGIVLDAVRLHLDEGTHPVLEPSDAAADVVAALDGSTSLRAAIRAVGERRGFDERGAGRLRREAIQVVRDLLEVGALRWG
jgi:methylase of polypeptide subunit release factors